MISVVAYSLLLAGVWCGTLDSPSNKIVGGENAPVGAYPHQASLQLDGHFCGGSFIGGTWILTAAHCFIGIDTSQITIVVGTNSLNAGGTRYSVRQVIPHERFSQIDLNDDIALIEVTENIVVTSRVRPIQLAAVLPPDYSWYRLSGWGITSYPSTSVPNDLQHIQMYQVPLEDCRAAFINYNVYDTNLCTYRDIGQGGCKGDSGGPLIFGDVQVGIVSWGEPCALGYPDVFTSVPSYIDWIIDNTRV